jgi:conjugative transfer signal peptidase TraF
MDFVPRLDRRSRRQLAPFVVAGAAVVATVAATSPAVLVNRSPSEPPGFYVRDNDPIGPGKIIAFKTPDAAFPYADATMPYLHRRPLLKAVAAGPGDLVCTTSNQLVINGRTLAPIARHDPQGRALPRWRGCRRMASDELFVFSARVPNSFDSRYYGPVRRSDVMGSYRRLALLGPETL